MRWRNFHFKFCILQFPFSHTASPLPAFLIKSLCASVVFLRHLSTQHCVNNFLSEKMSPGVRSCRLVSSPVALILAATHLPKNPCYNCGMKAMCAEALCCSAGFPTCCIADFQSAACATGGGAKTKMNHFSAAGVPGDLNWYSFCAASPKLTKTDRF